MDRTAYQAWLKKLVAEDRRRRDAAEPQLQRREAALTTARNRLADTKAAIAELEIALEAGREADGPESG